MKPFNLEEAKAGKPICFSDGEPCHFVGVLENPEIICKVVVEDKYGGAKFRRLDGTAPMGRFHLMMAPVKRTVYVNLLAVDPRESYKALYNQNEGSYFKHDTAEEAKRYANKDWNYLAIAAPIEIEE